MSDWAPVASHGMTEDEVRTALRAVNRVRIAPTLAEARRQLSEAGFSADAIERGLAEVERIADERIDQAVPQIMRNMAATAVMH